MSDGSIVTMLVICGLVWGGFAALLVRALLRERGRDGGETGAR